MTWDGKERRVPNNDHDILIEIQNDVKHLVKEITLHIKADDEIQNQIKKDLLFHNKIVYGCVGAFLFVEFIGKFIK